MHRLKEKGSIVLNEICLYLKVHKPDQVYNHEIGQTYSNFRHVYCLKDSKFSKLHTKYSSMKIDTINKSKVELNLLRIK